MPSIQYRTQVGQALEIEYDELGWYIVAIAGVPAPACECVPVKEHLPEHDRNAIKHQVQLARYGDKYFEQREDN